MRMSGAFSLEVVAGDFIHITFRICKKISFKTGADLLIPVQSGLHFSKKLGPEPSKCDDTDFAKKTQSHACD